MAKYYLLGNSMLSCHGFKMRLLLRSNSSSLLLQSNFCKYGHKLLVSSVKLALFLKEVGDLFRLIYEKNRLMKTLAILYYQRTFRIRDIFCNFDASYARCEPPNSLPLLFFSNLSQVSDKLESLSQNMFSYRVLPGVSTNNECTTIDVIEDKNKLDCSILL